MPGEKQADPIGTTTALSQTPMTEDTTSRSDREDLVSPTRTDEHQDRETGSPTTEVVRELELRLREQTAENAKLDTELRYLQAELAVRKEFITSLESELEAMRAQPQAHRELEAEYRAYRNRLSHRVADRLAASVHRLPWLSRPLKRFGRAVATVASRPGSHQSP